MRRDVKKNSLTDAAWVLVATNLPSGGSTTTNVVTAAGNTQFYRITSP